MNRPAFATHVEPAREDGPPHVITIAPLPAADEALLSRLVAGSIQSAVLDAAQPYTRRRRENDLSQIRGVLIIMNSDATNRPNQGMTEIRHLRDITTEFINDLIESVVQSGENLTISDLTFRFIIEPASIAVGRGGAKKPKYIKNVKFLKTWDQWVFSI